jgi:hypothetical protein
MMQVQYGKAAVWFCDPERNDAEVVASAENNAIAPGCGFFGLYKPEADESMRKCPACNNIDTYVKLPEWARIEVMKPDEM